MDLKQQLASLGYSEGEIEAISNKKKVYFQDDVDNIVMKKENSLKEKFSKTHISKTDYDLLSSEHNNLVKEVRTNKFKDEFIKNGGIEKYFDQYMKLNKELMDLEGEDMTKGIQSSIDKADWAFSAVDRRPNIPYQYQDTSASKDIAPANFDGKTIYGNTWENRRK